MSGKFANVREFADRGKQTLIQRRPAAAGANVIDGKFVAGQGFASADRTLHFRTMSEAKAVTGRCATLITNASLG
jgi:hypothetical protein